MKKNLLMSFGLLLTLFVGAVMFSSCEEEEDTETPEPTTAFFSSVIGTNNKSVTPGVNGYLAEMWDSSYSDPSGDHFVSGIRFYQASSGYYISSREVISFELVNLWDTLALNKDSLFHAYMSQGSLPFYTPHAVADSNYHTGVRIRWRTSDGEWYSTSELTQSGNLTVDTTRNTTVNGGLSSHEVYVRFDCTLYQEDGAGTMALSSGKARFSLMNTMFY